MNEYIINPWIFYWIGVSDVLKGVSLLFTILALGASMLSCLNYIENKNRFDDYDKTDYGYTRVKNEYQSSKLYFKTSVISLVIACSILIFVPNEKTIYRMLITSTLTKQNIEITRDFIIESIDKAVEKIIRRGEN